MQNWPESEIHFYHTDTVMQDESGLHYKTSSNDCFDTDLKCDQTDETDRQRNDSIDKQDIQWTAQWHEEENVERDLRRDVDSSSVA